MHHCETCSGPSTCTRCGYSKYLRSDGSLCLDDCTTNPGTIKNSADPNDLKCVKCDIAYCEIC